MKLLISFFLITFMGLRVCMKPALFPPIPHEIDFLHADENFSKVIYSLEALIMRGRLTPSTKKQSNSAKLDILSKLNIVRTYSETEIIYSLATFHSTHNPIEDVRPPIS